MGLYKDWTDLMESQTEETFEEFWQDYAGTEKKIYQHILATYPEKFSGSITEIAEKFDAKPVMVMGFCDGINESLNEKHELEKIRTNTKLDFDIDFEKLFFNMLKAEADYLYTLEEWSNVYDDDKLVSIVKAFKASKTVHVEKTPGRNDPCPCGSGKKYKKCCGANK